MLTSSWFMHFSSPSSKLGFKEEVQCFVGTTIGTRLGNQFF
jgi:hypothetical protein